MQDRSCKRQSLSLTAGQVAALFAQLHIKPAFLHNELVQIHFF